MDIASIDNGNGQQRLGLTVQPQEVSPEVTAQRREVVQAVKAVNQAELFGSGKEVTYSIDRQTRRVVTKLVDVNTGEVLNQIPAEYVLRLAEEYQQKT
jgi:uncharacterized FlaG/YvyC family protein